MKIYFAGVQTGWEAELEGQHVLVAFDQKRQLKVIDAWDNPVLLDSGAFATWRSGKEQDLEAYIAFIHEKKHRLDGYIAMDVIQGSAEANLANLDTMEAAGLRPIPVFHEGDDWQLLAEYLRRGYSYVGLGGTVSRGKQELVDWLLQVFDKFPPGPTLKYHGLAMTQERIITYLSDQFHSVDSSSWLNLCRFGPEANLYMLKKRSGKFLRRMGVEAFLDMPQMGGPPTKDGQLRLFTSEEMAG